MGDIFLSAAPPQEDLRGALALRGMYAREEPPAGRFLPLDRYDDDCGQAPSITFTSERFTSR